MTATDIYDYFKTIAVYGPERAKRIRQAEELEDFLFDLFALEMRDLEEGSFIENQNLRTEQFVKGYARIANIDHQTTARLMNEIGPTIAQNGTEAAVRLIQDKSISQYEKEQSEVILQAYKSADYIRETNMKELFKTPLQTTGYEDTPSRILLGLPVAAAALAGVKKLFGEERATSIAVNEAEWLSSTEEYYELVNSGQPTKSWMTMGDDRVRDAHAEMDGVTIPVDEYFIVNGYRMRGPMDTITEPNIPADLIIGCRCTLM